MIIETIAAENKRGAAARPKVGGFSYLAEAQCQAGVIKYYFDVPSMTVIYVTESGDILQPGHLIRTEMTAVLA